MSESILVAFLLEGIPLPTNVTKRENYEKLSETVDDNEKITLKMFHENRKETQQPGYNCVVHSNNHHITPSRCLNDV